MNEIYSEKFWKLFDELDVSLDPRGPEQLFDIALPYLKQGSRILDVGCRDARHLLKLVEITDGTGVGIDPVAWHIERARAAAAEAELTERTELIEGVAESLPCEDESFGVVWVRDVAEVLPDLSAAISEIARVLKPGGHVIVYTNTAEEEINSRENQHLFAALGNPPDNLVRSKLEGSFSDSGLSIAKKHVVGTEWREYLEETDHIVSRDLLRLARLRRQREKFLEAYGEAAYKTAEASLQWAVHQFLGRLVPVIYILTKES